MDVLSLANASRVSSGLTGTDLNIYEQELLGPAGKGDTGYCQDIEVIDALHGVDVRLARVARSVQVGAKALGWRDVSVGRGHDASAYRVAFRPFLPYLRGESRLTIAPETGQITLYTWCKVGGGCESPSEYLCRELGTWNLRTSGDATVAASILGAVAKQAAHDAIQSCREDAGL